MRGKKKDDSRRSWKYGSRKYGGGGERGGCCWCERLIGLKKAVPVFNSVLWTGTMLMPVQIRIRPVGRLEIFWLLFKAVHVHIMLSFSSASYSQVSYFFNILDSTGILEKILFSFTFWFNWIRIRIGRPVCWSGTAKIMRIWPYPDPNSDLTTVYGIEPVLYCNYWG